VQRLGVVLHISPSQNIILKIEEPPKIGSTVVDESLKIVGRVFDILGPVSSPYAVIRSTTQKAEELVNHKLYVIPSKRRKERKEK
jgi:RNA-binding protein